MGKSGNLFNDVVNKNVVMGVMVFTWTRSFDVWRELVLQSLAREGNETERMRFSRNVVLNWTELGATLRETPHVAFIDSDSAWSDAVPWVITAATLKLGL